MKLDFSAAWKDAMTMLRGQREMLIALAGVFLLLPSLLLETFAPLRSSAQTLDDLVADLSAYMSENGLVILIVTIVTYYGQATILKLLLDPKRPTVGDALGGALRLLPAFFLVQVIVGLIWLAGLFALVIPGLYLIGRTVLAGTVMVAEDRHNPLTVIQRSFAVTRGNGWAVFFVVAIVWVVGWIMGIAAASIFGVVMALVGDASLVGFGTAFVSSLFAAALQLVLLLLYIALYRQLSAEPSVAVN